MIVKEKIDALQRAQDKLRRERAEIERKIKLNETEIERLLDWAKSQLDEQEVPHS